MAHPLRFSVLVLPNVAWPELLRRCQEVEALGFDTVSFADHFTDWAGGKGPWFELWTKMSAVAMATKQVRLQSLVAQIPLRNPAMFALQALTVDHISGGRLDVGLGTGLELDPSYRMMGEANWTPKERVARFGEYVAIVDRLLRGEELTIAGKFYSTDGAVLRPAAVQSPRPPILIAAMGPVMLRHAARHADIWNSLSFAKTFDEQLAETAQRVTDMTALCAGMGRDPASLRRSYLMYDPTARTSGGRVSYYESEEAFARMVERVLAQGMDEIGLYYPTLESQHAMFARIARDVLPGLPFRRICGCACWLP